MTLKAWLITPWAADALFDSYQAIAADDLVIAVDGGLKRCKELALTAHYLCGDLDSLDLELSESFPADKLWRFPKDKNETDTELAMVNCLQLGIRELVICNDMQGRADHFLGLIQNLLWAQENHLKASIQSGSQKIFIIDKIWQAQALKGHLLSLVAINQAARLKDSTGLKWNLKDLTLYPHLSRGISNLIVENQIKVEVSEGLVLAILTKIG